MLFFMFLGLGPLNNLTAAYAQIYRPQSSPASSLPQTAMAQPQQP
jgi:hypothetical protein